MSVGVGRVVAPLPGQGEERDQAQLRGTRPTRLAEPVHVQLDVVGVGGLTETVVMQLIVLVRPRGRIDPVVPVEPSTRTLGESAAGARLWHPGYFVVAAVHDVMGDHRPAS